jgi:O-antigen/teichoic acid export membrane protein
MRVASGTGLRMASYAAGGLLSLVSIPLLVRHLGVADFGRYVAVLSVVGIAALASDLGITGLALREYSAAAADERPALLRGLLGVRIAIATLGAAAAVAFAIAAGYASAAVVGTGIACTGLFAQVYADLVVVSLIVASRFGRAALVDLARSAAATGLIVVLVIAGAGLVWFLASYALAALAGAIVARRLATEGVGLRPRMPSGQVRVLLAGSLAYAAATAVHVVYFRSVMLVVSVQATALQAGWFGTAFRLAEFVAAAAAIAASTVTPALVHAARDGRFAPFASRLVSVALAAGVLVGATVARAAPLIVRVLGGEELVPATQVVRIEAVAMGLAFPVFATGAALLVMRRHADLLAANAAGLVVALVAALLLVPAHGARGGAAAAALAEAALFLALGAALVRVVRRSRADRLAASVPHP